MAVKVTKPEINVREKISELSGPVAYQDMPAGSVIQVVQAGTFNNWTINSTTYAAWPGLVQKITPRFANSKILIQANFPAVYFDGAKHLYSTVYRDGVNLNTNGSLGFGLMSGNTSSGNSWDSGSWQYMDSPNTTNEITYQIYARNNSAGAFTYTAEGGSYNSITLWEIKQ